ncbi:MAG: hypothetical protein M1820_006934 [Bogoriella megaspora]|nr:MAG: hypothetical protein M1820_006934 [Bogoriella megaspora]
MEVLTEEESRSVMNSMVPPFTKHEIDKHEPHRPGSPAQNVLLIHGPGQQYKLSQQEIPSTKSNDEILIKVIAVGLNPIDWKGPDYNFGLPSLPWINGRDLAGVVVKAPKNLRRIRVGDVILTPSTDYRDIRKAAFQEYAISTEHNCARVPRDMPIQTSAVLGVAYVTSAIALGICLGLDLSSLGGLFHGPNLRLLLRQVDPNLLASDVKEECLSRIVESDYARDGEWIAIWGASSATGLVALQIAKLCKLRTICIADIARHGERLLQAGADLLVDRYDTERAIEIIRGVTKGKLHYGLDTVGKETATKLQQCLASSSEDNRKSHLVGLTGLPKETVENVIHHKVPIKVFHDVPQVGESLMTLLEKLLLGRKLLPPEVETAVGGLNGINEALDLLRSGMVTGKRLVVPLDQSIKRTALAA